MKQTKKRRGLLVLPAVQYCPVNYDATGVETAMDIARQAALVYRERGIDVYSKTEFIGLYVYQHFVNDLPVRIERILNRHEKELAKKRRKG